MNISKEQRDAIVDNIVNAKPAAAEEEDLDYGTVYIIIEHDYKTGGYKTIAQSYYTSLEKAKNKIARLNATCEVGNEPYDYAALPLNK